MDEVCSFMGLGRNYRKAEVSGTTARRIG
jgi:hypothetical protein